MNEKKIIVKLLAAYFLVIYIITSFIVVLDYLSFGLIKDNVGTVPFVVHYFKFVGSSVIPLLLVLCISLVIYIYPLYKYLKINNINMHSDKKDSKIINEAKNRVYNLSFFIFIQNFLAFLAGFFILVYKFDYINNLTVSSIFYYLIFTLAGASIYTFIQTSINNYILNSVKEHFRLYYIDEKIIKKQKFSSLTFKINILLLLITLYIFCFMIHNQSIFYQQKTFYSELLSNVIEKKIALDEAEKIKNDFMNNRNTAINALGKQNIAKKTLIYDLFGITSFILLILISFIASKTYVKELKTQIDKQKQTIDDIMNGKENFSKRLSILQFDEIGSLTGTINLFLDKFKNILETIFSNTSSAEDISGMLDKSLFNASSAIEEMVTSMKQIKSNSDQQKLIVEKIRGKIEEMLIGIEGAFNDVNELSSFVQETSSAMQETNSSIHTVSINTEKVNNLANNLVEISKSGSVSVSNTVESIKEINEATGKVIEIVDIINNLSSQTDLLAMNAAIEAAHAGDSGKGFAVVADEIRNLSIKSKEYSTQIIKHIKEMVLKVDKGVKLSSDTGNSFNQISNDITITTQLIGQVTGAIHEQSQATADIMTSIDSMLKATIELKEISDELKIQSEIIHKYMDELHNISMENNQAVAEQDRGNKEILELVSIVKDSSVKNISIVENLNLIISKYKMIS